MKKEFLIDSRLTVIVAPSDAERLGLPLDEIVREAALGGADLIQLRDKVSTDEELLVIAGRLAPVARRHGAAFIVNDRPQIAKLSGADGVHLGQEDAAVRQARLLLGDEAIIGKSTHSLKQALAAREDGADYIGFGPIYPTPTKPDYRPVGLEALRAAVETVRIPLFAIGGIDLLTLNSVLETGAKRVAVVRAATPNRHVLESVRGLKRALKQSRGRISPC